MWYFLLFGIHFLVHDLLSNQASVSGGMVCSGRRLDCFRWNGRESWFNGEMVFSTGLAYKELNPDASDHKMSICMKKTALRLL